MTVRRRWHPLIIIVVFACGGSPEPDRAARDAGSVADSAEPRQPASSSGPVRNEADVSDSVRVVFTRDEQPFTVWRPVPPSERTLSGALTHLVRGPNADEKASGLHSWFSDATSHTLSSVNIDDAGHATVDFHNLASLIPNASTSAGSAMLLQQLNGTVFQFENVASVEYRMDGSCDAFWQWLQRSCQTVHR